MTYITMLSIWKSYGLRALALVGLVLAAVVPTVVAARPAPGAPPPCPEDPSAPVCLCTARKLLAVAM